MAGWLKIALRSFAAAVGAGAAQLGTAHALGILAWSPVPAPDVWRREVSWLLFIFAAAVLAGVAGGRRSVRTVRLAIANRRAEAAGRPGVATPLQSGVRGSSQRAAASARHRAVDLARRVAIASTRVYATAFAALGAYATFVLVWLPARNGLPATDLGTLALAAAIGTGVGAVLALFSLAAAPVAANTAIWLGGMWIFGLSSAALAIATGRPTMTPRLGVLDAPDLIGPDEWWLGPNVMIPVAALFALAVAGTARWVGARPFTIAVSGLAGPAIVAAAYIIVGAGDGLRSAYVAALVATAVGGLTSIVTALARRPGKQAAAATPGVGAPAAGTPIPAAPVPASAPAPVAAPAAAAPAPAYAAAAPYPQPNPAWQYPAGTQYSANPYPTNQYPTMSGWSQPAATPPPAPPPPPAPVAAPPAVTPSRAPKRGKARAATPAAAPVPTQTPAPAAKAAKAAKGAKAAATTAAAAATTAAAAKPTPKPTKTRSRAERTVPEAQTPAKKETGRRTAARKQEPKPEPVKPEPVRSSRSADDDLPRTRPARVVGVQASRPSSDAETVAPTGRRARRRAAKLEAARAEEEARRAKQIELEEKSMGKREREHVDWVKHLTSIPVDPTLTRRE